MYALTANQNEDGSTNAPWYAWVPIQFGAAMTWDFTVVLTRPTNVNTGKLRIDLNGLKIFQKICDLVPHTSDSPWVNCGLDGRTDKWPSNPDINSRELFWRIPYMTITKIGA